MTTTLERAARAAYEALQKSEVYLSIFNAHIRTEEDWLDEMEPTPTLTTVDGRVDLTAVARAVLMAVREPDEQMCDAGNDADYYSSEGCDINFLNMDRHGDKPATGIVFTAMIDAILAEGE